MRNLIIGMGQIGKAVREVISVYDVQTKDIQDTAVELPVDVLHITFPYTEDFVEYVKQYIRDYKPKYVIIYSTVPIGTCEQIAEHVVHSPVEGRHPDLDLSITYMERWIGTTDHNAAQFFTGFFKDLNLRVKVVNHPRYTEALKLLSTSEYGVNLLFADYKKQVADAIDMPFELTKQWNQEYNRLYDNLGLGDRIKKYVLDPPGGIIGGHCIRENSFLLDKQFPNDMLKMIKQTKGAHND